ncbi:MAG TPA: HAD family hydrolase [Burkholderiales bacterium]|nr:HAD family hydrolase [Burkholderiales bacterium]
MRLIDDFKALLFDMNSTFMFGEDRFHDGEDFHRTYISMGGRALSAAKVDHYIRACYAGMSRDFEDPACYESFPTLAQGLRRYASPPEDELPILERVFAFHELGSVPESSAVLLRRLAVTHKLALVANIWAPKQAWLDEFKRAGMEGVFDHAVFSSDFGHIKPSPLLYHKALQGVGARPQDAIFVGDSLRYDMEGAKKVGMTTVWVTPELNKHSCVDHAIQTILELETYVAQPNVTADAATYRPCG